ncbi:MAG: hypothetical protein LC102_09060 [Ignavibacteriales bacterium]|jgi:hypothetical protein|nr:MAG: hypothetical protein F9K26_05355 [Ignavibacteriaceae bacterium]MBW7872843.1 hypothetical protein [Ignavibacteria bacterium]MCZ2143563.1 hypothetical protein [Ignavibacteriales bacterium]MBV6444438.1 hypothetical protein [Ignavibacteriaceae bacterium]MBZ0197243.1 hypothetical protein [Ignavibacteriaceae bacterium]
MKISIGWRKYSAFLFSLATYAVLFILVLVFRFINSTEIPAFAFQLGMGISAVTGVYYGGNALAKRFKSGANEY